MSQFTYDDAIDAVFGSAPKVRDPWDDAIDAVYSPPRQYVAGGPGGIPGAKDGLPADQNASLSFGYPGEAPEPKYGPDTIRSIMAFKQQVKAQGGDIDGKSDAEVLGLMRRFGPVPGATASDYQPQTTPLDEFGRGLRRGAAYGLPVGLPGVEALRESEQVQRAPEGLAGFVGQTLGGFTGLINPEQAPANFGAIVFTGGVGKLAAGTLDVIGKNVAESLGKEAGARAVNMIREAIENAGQGGGMAALNELGNIPIDDWKSKPGESTMRVLKAAGIGAAAGMGLGAAFGAASKEARPVPRGTLPERVFDRMLTADEVQQSRMGAASAQEGRGAMLDAANVYAAAPRVGGVDYKTVEAVRQADQMAMDQARASARAIDESTPAPVREPTPAQETSSEVPEAQGQGRQEGLLKPTSDSMRPRGIASRAGDSTTIDQVFNPATGRMEDVAPQTPQTYDELVKRAKGLGVYRDGPKTRAALAERVKAAESGSRAEAPQSGGVSSTSEAAQASEAPSQPRESPQTESPLQASERASSPNATRQPWEMTKAMADSAVFAADPRKGVASHIEDWGRMPRGQGKRIGGMVVGAMSDAPRGKKTYVDPVGAFNLTKDEKVDVGGLVGGQINVYSRSRVAGFGHTESMIYAETPNTGDRHRAVVEWALREGRPVPPEVLADYPDLAASAKFPKKSETPKSPDMVDRYGIYEVNVKGRGTMYAVRESDRANGYGDTIHATKDEAAKYAQETKARNEANAASKARDDAAMAEKERLESEKRIANETTYGVGAFTKDMTPMERGRTEKALSKQVSIDGVVLPLKEHVASMVGENPHMEVRQEWKVPDVKRTTWNRMDQRQQDNWQKRRDSSGKYNVYRVNGYDFGKTGYDYAAFLIERNKVSDPAKPPTPAESGTTPKPPRDGWTLELEGSGRRYWRSPDGKEIAREDGSMLRFESKSHVWDNGGKERMAKAIGASTESPAKAIQDVPTTRPPSTVAELKESLVRVQKSQGKRYALKMQSEWMKNRESWGVSPYDDLEEYRSAGYVTRSNDGSKYTLLVVSGTDTPKWRIASKIDVTDQFVKAPDAAPLPTEAARGTTPAGTEAGQVEAPKASGKPTDYPGTAQGTAPKEGSPGTTAKEDAPSHPENHLGKEAEAFPDDLSPRTSLEQKPLESPEQSAASEQRSGGPARSVNQSEPSSHDFTARRVVNKPEPGEPEGPVTSARNAMMDEDRFALGLDAADGPERRSWQSALDTAVARKIPDDALGIAAEVNAKPRPLDDIETAGLVYKANELKNRHRELMNEIGGTKDESVIRDRAIKAARIEDEFDTLSTALRKAGTEQGRALASRKLTLREDYSLVAIKSRAKAAAGRELTPAENAKFEAMSKSLEDASTKIASLEKELADLQADSTIKRHAASKRGIPKEAREKIIVDLAANVRQLIESGCR